MAEAASLPDRLGAIVERLVVAELSYLARLAALARAEVARCDDELAGPLAEWRATVRALHRLELRRESRERVPAEEFDELHDRRVQLVAAMRPASARRDEAAMVADICRGRAEGLYGVRLVSDPTGRAAPGPSWEQAAREAGQRAARALRAGG